MNWQREIAFELHPESALSSSLGKAEIFRHSPLQTILNKCNLIESDRRIFHSFWLAFSRPLFFKGFHYNKEEPNIWILVKTRNYAPLFTGLFRALQFSLSLTHTAGKKAFLLCWSKNLFKKRFETLNQFVMCFCVPPTGTHSKTFSAKKNSHEIEYNTL